MLHSKLLQYYYYHQYQMQQHLVRINGRTLMLLFLFFALVFLSSSHSSRLLCLSCLRAAIGRTLIPRYFSTVFEGGVSELHYILKHSKESFHNSCITLDCDQCTMVTQHGKPMFTKVTADPRASPTMNNWSWAMIMERSRCLTGSRSNPFLTFGLFSFCSFKCWRFRS